MLLAWTLKDRRLAVAADTVGVMRDRLTIRHLDESGKLHECVRYILDTPEGESKEVFTPWRRLNDKQNLQEFVNDLLYEGWKVFENTEVDG